MPSNSVKRVLTYLTLTITAMAALPSDARASGNDYCREYTRTVYIGGNTQEAYGTACLQPDGSWMIVGEGLGSNVPQNTRDVDYIIHDGRQNIIPPRVVYYSQPHVVYRTRHVQPTYVWYNHGHHKKRYYKNYRYGDRHGHHGHRYDRDWNHGRGRH